MGRTGHIGDRYRLVERLGTGGMSVVWRGFDEILGRPVAVKVLAPQLATDDAFRERLRQEAMAAARLCHPNITGVFDYGESPLDNRLTIPYVVMELNGGQSVGARLNRSGALPWRDAVVMAAQVASALATAHARGIVHRDVTPANVMLTGTGAKVVDFGISALVGQRDSAPDGSLLGTPAYLAPERLSGGQVSPATDVYALGLLLYRALTARLPWPAQNTAEALRAHLYADPEPLPTLPGMPPEVAQVCLGCLAKRPADRPTAGTVASALGALVGLRPVVVPPVQDPATAVRATAVAAPPPDPRSRGLAPPDPRRRGLAPPDPRRRGLAPPGPRSRGLALLRAGLGHLGRPGGVPVTGALMRAGLGYLGLPGGAPVMSAPLLRAGLRFGSALRLGACAQSLGGGLFVGGRLGRAAFAGRNRLQATVATLTVLGIVGLTWTSTREPVDVGPAQAAAAGAGRVSHSVCKVRYQVRRDSGIDFEAQVTVGNTGSDTLSGWSVEFTYPGTQRVTGSGRRASQKGRRVIVRAKADLSPGESAAVMLRGVYRGTNPLPLSFSLNGHDCRSEVLGAVVAPPPPPSPAAPPRSSVPGSAGPSGPTPESPTPAGTDDPIDVRQAAGGGPEPSAARTPSTVGRLTARALGVVR